ncbi:MAG: ribose 5-phosphate isomerase B [Bacteroidales bacterium]|nr:ribose 5-phosphate isomerase B [Bacteroidales bacterium]
MNLQEKKLAIASDHAGFEMKEKVKVYLESKGFDIKDFGAFSSESSDYPDFAHPMASAVENGEFTRGITLCGSGNGINITANKHAGIRSAICWRADIARLAREHNDANVCAIPARFIDENLAKEIVDTFLTTEFEGGRHQRRVDKIPIK